MSANQMSESECGTGRAPGPLSLAWRSPEKHRAVERLSWDLAGAGSKEGWSVTAEEGVDRWVMAQCMDFNPHVSYICFTLMVV